MVSDTSQCHSKPSHHTSAAPGCPVVYQAMISNLSGRHVPDQNRSPGVKYCIAGHHKAPQTNWTCYITFNGKRYKKIRCEYTHSVVALRHYSSGSFMSKGPFHHQVFTKALSHLPLFRVRVSASYHHPSTSPNNGYVLANLKWEHTFILNLNILVDTN